MMTPSVIKTKDGKSNTPNLTKSVNNTVKLLEEFERKKEFFDLTISNLKSFQPSPQVIKKRSTRVKSGSDTDKVITQPSGEQNDTCENNFILKQLKYLYDFSHDLISSLNNFQSEYINFNLRLQEVDGKISQLCKNLDEISQKTVVTLQEPRSDSSDSQLLNSVNDNENQVEKKTTNELIINLQNKIAQLEQKEVNSYFILQGVKAHEIIKHCESINDANLLDVLKSPVR